MATLGVKLTARHERAIATLLASSSLPVAAATCGVSERTLRRWMKCETFSRRYGEERALLLNYIVNALREKSLGAVRTLATVADNSESSDAARVSASRGILELTLRAAELLDVEQRLAKLEALAKDRQ